MRCGREMCMQQKERRKKRKWYPEHEQTQSRLERRSPHTVQQLGKRISERTHTNRHLAKMIEDIFSRALRETRWEKTILWHCICDAENPQSRTTHHKVPSPSHNTEKSKPFSRRVCLHLGNISQAAPTQEARIGCKRNTSSSEASATQTSALRSVLGWFFTVSTLRFIRSASDDFVGKENFSVSIFHIFSFFSPVHFVNSSLTHDVPTGSIADFHSFWPRIESRIKWLLQSVVNGPSGRILIEKILIEYFRCCCAITRQLFNWQIAEEKSLSEIRIAFLRVCEKRKKFFLLVKTRERNCKYRTQFEEAND